MKTLQNFTYDHMLNMHYGDVQLLIDNLREGLELYKNASSQNHPVVKERISTYTAILKKAEANKPEPSFIKVI